MTSLFLGNNAVSSYYLNNNYTENGLAYLFKKTTDKGVMFNPSRVGTLYQTTAMKIPARVGDPVGMMLDQSQWGDTALGDLYGPELLSSPNLSTDSSGGVTPTQQGDSYRAVGNTGGMVVRSGQFNAEAGKLYDGVILMKGDANYSGITAALRSLSNLGLTLSNTVTLSISQSYTEIRVQFTPTISKSDMVIGLRFSGNGTESINVRSISIREVTVADALEPIMGPELDRRFPDKSASWIDNGDGSYSITGDPSEQDLRDSTVLTVGKTYLFEFEVVGAAIQVYLGTGAFGYSAGKHTVASLAVNQFFIFRATNSQTTTIKGVSVREIKGHHATQATAAKRPTYGIHPKGGLRNLLTYTEDFGNAVWVNQNVTVGVASIAAPAPVSGSPVWKVTETTGSGYHAVTQAVSGLSGGDVLSVYAKAAEHGAICMFNGGGGFVKYDLALGTVSSAAKGKITAVGDGWFRCEYRHDSTTNPLYIAVTRGDLVPNYAGDGVSGVYLSAPQMEKGTVATDYQKVVSKYEVTEAGVPSVHYLSFDGVDDAMVTPSIDFTATDEMSVFAGVRKLSDAASAIIADLGTGTQNGNFSLSTSLGTAANYALYNKGTVEVGNKTANNYPAPLSSVLSGSLDISADLLQLRVNGSQALQILTDQGTGNYGNYQLNIGSRDGTSLFFKGNLYTLTVRGKTTSDGGVSRAEKLIAAKTGIEI